MPTNFLSPKVNISEINLTTSVPSVSTSVGGIAGVFRWGPVGLPILVTTETDLVNNFGRPSAINPETWFTASSFLSYGTALNVVRAADTTNSNSSLITLNAIANTTTVNTANQVVKSVIDYESRNIANSVNTALFDTGMLYVARYPGDIGNSLRVSVCDSTKAYSSNLALAGILTGNTITGNAVFAVGSNVATVTFGSSGDVGAANTFGNTVAAGISVNDLITIGNSTIGYQTVKVSNVGTIAVSGTNAVFTVGLSSNYRLSTNYIATTIQRSWEFANVVTFAPTTSQYTKTNGNTAAIDTLSIVIVDQKGAFTGVSGTILEIYQNLSRASDAKSADGQSIWYKNEVNQSSKYIWYAGDSSNAVSATSASVASSLNGVPLSLQFNGGADGFTEAGAASGNTAALNVAGYMGTLATGYDVFKTKSSANVSLIMQGKPIGGTTVINGITVSNYQLANYIIDNITSTRKDCVAFISPDDALVRTNVGNEQTVIAAWAGALSDSTYSVRDSGYKYMYDRYNDVYRYVPLNGDVAGLCARTDQTNDSWWSPAGFNRGQIKNVIKLRFNPGEAQRDVLYQNSVNPVVSFPGQGTILFGDKTGTTQSSAFDRIGVRRLFITLENSIATASKYSLFEFNDAFTRASFVNLITPYLRNVQSRRGISDFLVVCDGTNNTQNIIDSNQFVGDIYIKPNRSINFIQLNFVAVSTGVSFSTVVGQL